MTPVRLHKKTEPTLEGKIQSYAYIIVPICLIILMILLIYLLAILLGHVSATESGAVYNHLKDVI